VFIEIADEKREKAIQNAMQVLKLLLIGASLACLYTLNDKRESLFAIWVLTSACLFLAATIYFFGKLAILKCIQHRKDADAKKNEIEILSDPVPKQKNVEMTNLNFHGDKKDLHVVAERDSISNNSAEGKKVHSNMHGIHLKGMMK
jgi:hypothetical protein